MTYSRKELLRAAKSDISSKLEEQIKDFEEEMEVYIELMEAVEEHSHEYDELRSKWAAAKENFLGLTDELEKLGKKKSLKKQMKSSLEWKADRKELRVAAKERQKVTVRDNEALKRVRSSEAKKKQLQAGEWLYEGALVKHRKSPNPLIGRVG